MRVPSISISLFRSLRLLLVLLVMVVAMPRFNMNDVGIVAAATGDGAVYDTIGSRTAIIYSPDVQQYTSYVHFFRSEAQTTAVAAPFSYRPLIPAIASLLPLDALTSIDIVNVFFLMLGCVVLDLLLASYGTSFFQRIIGMLLYACCFPVFYYGATGRVDSAGIALSIGLMLSVQRSNTTMIMVVALLAAAAKETTIVTVVACILGMIQRRNTGDVSRAVMLGVTFILGVIAVRLCSPGDVAHHWSPSVSDLVSNLTRPRALISSGLAFGPVGLLAVWQMFRQQINLRDDRTVLLMTGILGSIGVWIFSLLSAYTDGRFVWIAYPFLLPFAVDLFRSKQTDR